MHRSSYRATPVNAGALQRSYQTQHRAWLHQSRYGPSDPLFRLLFSSLEMGINGVNSMGARKSYSLGVPFSDFLLHPAINLMTVPQVQSAAKVNLIRELPVLDKPIKR